MGFVCKEMVDFGYCPIVGNDSKAFVIHIKDQVLALLAVYRTKSSHWAWMPTMTARPIRPISPLWNE